MRNIILFDDDDSRSMLLPLTYTRPVGELRIGILTIREKWEHWLEGTASFITQEYLAERFPIVIEEDNYIINSTYLPTRQLASTIKTLNQNEALLKNGELVATRLNGKQIEQLIKDEEIDELQGYELEDLESLKINQLSDLFRLNARAIEIDFEQLTTNRISQELDESNLVKGANQIFVEEGAEVSCCILNAANGPIYIGKNAKLLEGSAFRGPIAIGEHTVVKMGAKIYGATTIGPYSKVGGEINNSVFLGYSNKGHDGYLGNSIIGTWCNIGADTNVSNLKNNYSIIKQWNYKEEDFVSTGLQFCGLVMGDHSKCGINTMFNTGTVVGVSASIFGTGFPPKFIPSFAWGGADGFETYHIEKAFHVAELVMKRRDIDFEVVDRLILVKLFEDTAKHRTWEDEDSGAT